jgi:hypothetical protein
VLHDQLTRLLRLLELSRPAALPRVPGLIVPQLGQFMSYGPL